MQATEEQLSLISQLEKADYTPEQQAFIEYDGKNSVILVATAGSGKTFSSIQRLKELLKRGVDPSKIIFFSYTKAATEELEKRIGRKDVKITTIHAFALGLLSKMGKFRIIITFYDFIKWYKTKYKPSTAASQETKSEFYELISDLYEDGEFISSEISAYKLQTADGIKCPIPTFFQQYREFLFETRSRDFADMLIEVRDLLKEDKWLKMFRNQYDYIFVDEYQDTSTIQMQILMALNAKYYYLIGDKNQSIYKYLGVNCKRIEEMLKSRRTTEQMTLSVNFRSDTSIIENSNQFSSLKAIAESKEQGFVDETIITEIESKSGSLSLVDVLKKYDEVAVLVRTNAAVRDIEFELLKRKFPMRYFNYIKPEDKTEFLKDNVHVNLRKKLNTLLPYFGNEMNIFTFIEQNKSSKKIVTTIHKSKGREFDYCVVVNCMSPFLVQKIGLDKVLPAKTLDKITFDPYDEEDVEPRNVHYVAISRSRHGLYFMLYKF